MNQLDAIQFFTVYLEKLPEIRKRQTLETSQRRNLIPNEKNNNNIFYLLDTPHPFKCISAK